LSIIPGIAAKFQLIVDEVLITESAEIIFKEGNSIITQLLSQKDTTSLVLIYQIYRILPQVSN